MESHGLVADKAHLIDVVEAGAGRGQWSMYAVNRDNVWLI